MLRRRVNKREPSGLRERGEKSRIPARDGKTFLAAGNVPDDELLVSGGLLEKGQQHFAVFFFRWFGARAAASQRSVRAERERRYGSGRLAECRTSVPVSACHNVTAPELCPRATSCRRH